MSNETTVNNEDQALKKTMTWLMVGLFGIFFGLIYLESLSETERDLQALGAQTLIVQTDVSKLSDVENLADQAFASFDTVDLLVNNAGVASPGSVLESTFDDWKWVIGVNFYGVLHGVKLFAPRLMEQATSSRIVNVSSLAGIIPSGESYGVSKHAVLLLTESLHRELATKAPHVRVSAFCPGWVASEFYRGDSSRPERFNSEATVLSDEYRAGWRQAIEDGVSTDETTGFLFDGMAQDKLYIGPHSFGPSNPELADLVQQRTQNVLNEQNPIIATAD